MSPIEQYKTLLEERYAEDIEQLGDVSPEEPAALYVEIADIYDHNEQLGDDYINEPDKGNRHINAAYRALTDDAGSVNVRVTDTEGYLDALHLGELEDYHVGRYVAVQGQLSKISKKLWLLESGAFECVHCGTIENVPQPYHKLQHPYECDSCGEDDFRLRPGLSDSVNERQLKIQTPPDEAAKTEGMDTDVSVTDDLCAYGGENGLPDRAGEKCTIIAKREIDRSEMDKPSTTPRFETWLKAEAIVFHSDDDEHVDIEAHKETIEEAMARDDPVTYFRDNIAPALDIDDDLETVLEASVAWMFGAYRVDQDEGQYRGDIHFGLIGDPGVGKSTLLSELHRISPHSEFRSGTGLTEVGLTAATVQEEFMGESEWALKPGILPRANGGHCIIDEVDDVLDGDTKAIHDALEGEQMVKIDKAGITADLETRTGLLASGNPVHGRFDRYEPIAEQVDLDPALLDRMDILLDLQDEVDEERDRKKARHYIESYDEVSRKQLYERGELDTKPEMNTANRDISVEAMRAWVAYARQNVFPVLTEEAEEELEDFYVDTRNMNGGHEAANKDDAIPATPRTLAAGVRISTAFARAEGSDTVEKRHVDRAKAITKETIGLNYDPVTGEVDAGNTDKGELSRVGKFKRTIAALEDEENKADVAEAVDRLADEYNMTKQKAEHEIEKLKHKGEVYAPETGTLRTT